MLYVTSDSKRLEWPHWNDSVDVHSVLKCNILSGNLFGEVVSDGSPREADHGAEAQPAKVADLQLFEVTMMPAQGGGGSFK